MNAPKKPSLFLGLLVAMLWGFAHPADAQTSITSSTASVSRSLQATDYNLQTGTATLRMSAAHTLSIQSTSNWALTVQAVTPTFSFAGDGSINPSKQAADLAVRVAGIGSWLALSTSPKTVTTGAAQAAESPPAEVSIDYQFSSNLKSDPPGSYSISIIWTVTQP